MPGLAKEPQTQPFPTHPAPPRMPSSRDDRALLSAPSPGPTPIASDIPCSPRQNLFPRRPERLIISAGTTLPASPEPGGCSDTAGRPAPSLTPQPPAIGSPSSSSSSSPRARSFSSRTIRIRQPLNLTFDPRASTGALQDSGVGGSEDTALQSPRAPPSTVNARSPRVQDSAPHATSASDIGAAAGTGTVSTPAAAAASAGCPASPFEPPRPGSAQWPASGDAARAVMGAGRGGTRGSVDFAHRNGTSGAAAALRALEVVTAAAESWDALRAHHLAPHSSTSDDSDGVGGGGGRAGGGDGGDARRALSLRRPSYGPRGMSRSSSGIASTEPNAWVLRTAVPPGRAQSIRGALRGAGGGGDRAAGEAATHDDGSRTISASEKATGVSSNVVSGPRDQHPTRPATNTITAAAAAAQSATGVAGKPQPASELDVADKSGGGGGLTLRILMMSMPQHRSGQRTELRLGSKSGGGGGGGGLWDERRETRGVTEAVLGVQAGSEDGSFTTLMTMSSRQPSGSFSSPSSPSPGSPQLRRQQAMRGRSRSGLVTGASLLEPGTSPSRQQSSQSESGASRKDTGGDDDGDARRQGTSVASLEDTQEGAQAASAAASILDTARLLADAAERRRLSYDGLSRHASKYSSMISNANADGERGGATAATPVIAAAAKTAGLIADAAVPASPSAGGQPHPAPLQLLPGDSKPPSVGRGTSDTATASAHAPGGGGSNSVSTASSPAAHSKVPLITALTFERAPWSGHSSGAAASPPSHSGLHPLPQSTGSSAVGGLLLPPSQFTTGAVPNKHPSSFSSFRSSAPGLMPHLALPLPAAEGMQPTASPRDSAPETADTGKAPSAAAPSASPSTATTAGLPAPTAPLLDPQLRNSPSSKLPLPFAPHNTPLPSTPAPRLPNAGRRLSAGATFSTTTISSISYAPAAAAAVNGASPPRSSLALRSVSSFASPRSLRGGAPSSSFLERLGTGSSTGSSGAASTGSGQQQAGNASATVTINTVNSVSGGGGISSSSSTSSAGGAINSIAGSRVPDHSRRTISGLVEPPMKAPERAKSISGGGSSSGEGSYWRREGSCSLDGSGLEASGDGGYGRYRRRATEDGTGPDDGLVTSQGYSSSSSSRGRATAEDCGPTPIGDGAPGLGIYSIRRVAKHTLLRGSTGLQMALSEAIMEDGGEGGDAAREDDATALPPPPPQVEEAGPEVDVEEERKEDAFASWASQVSKGADLHHTC